VCGVHDAIEDRVGEGGVAELGMPVLDRQLAGDHRRAAADTVVEELEQIAALLRRRRGYGVTSSGAKRMRWSS
jgi:hypothetical protein